MGLDVRVYPKFTLSVELPGSRQGWWNYRDKDPDFTLSTTLTKPCVSDRAGPNAGAPNFPHDRQGGQTHRMMRPVRLSRTTRFSLTTLMP
jgi:hypothetical protein